MAIALRSSAEANTASDTTHTVTAPSGAASGDVLVGFWYCATTDDWTGPGGWTSALAVNDAVYGSFIVARKILSAAPDATYAATTTGAVDSWGIITAWTGANTTTPEDVSAASSTASDPYPAPSLTTATDGAAMICFYGENASPETGTKAGTQTLIDDGTNAGVSYLASYELRATAGTTGTKAITGWSGSAQCASYALRPAAAAATAVPNAAMLMGIGI